MLVLSRKVDQTIAIGDTTEFERLVKVTVLGISNGTVRLGFEVDSSVPVHRWEVWQRIHEVAETNIAGKVFKSANQR